MDSNDLARALERDELLLHYQPIVDVRTRQCRRVEALLRWKHPRFGVLLPGAFMPAASSAALLASIGRWVIRTAVRQWLEWREQGEALGVSVNLAGPDLADVEEIVGALRELHSGAMTFELTPGVLGASDRAVRDAIVRLAAAGARIALDDVGPVDAPGRSLAAALDEIKIARSLVKRAAIDARALADLRGLIELARDYRLTSVAVGIEDATTHDLLSSLGCGYAQGYWVSRPLVPDRLAPARRWAVGLAFGGALAFATQAGAGRAIASGGGGVQVPLQAGGFLSSACCLDLPTSTIRQPSPATDALDQLRQRTGRSFTSDAAKGALIFSEESVDPGLRSAVVRAVDRDIEELERGFGRSLAARPSIYLFATRASFALGLQQLFGVRGPDAGLLAAANGGVTLSRQGAIVLNLQNVRSDRDLAIVRHELTHALVHEIVGPDVSLPAWFEEGLATLEERKAITGGADAVRHAAVALSIVSEDKTTLRDLELVTQWAQRNAALDGQAYTVSAEAVRLIEQSVSRDGLVGMLEATGSGSSFGEAFAAQTGESLADFERGFAARLAADQGTPRIVQAPYAEGVRWTLAGFTPQSAVTIRIEGTGYQLEYEVTTDRYGMYQAVFGGTAPRGEYTLRASRGPSATTAQFRI